MRSISMSLIMLFIAPLTHSTPHRFEAEKEELLRRLRDAENQYSTARDRQSLRVKLRLEKKRLQQQETFEEAMLVLGMASKAGDRYVFILLKLDI